MAKLVFVCGVLGFLAVVSLFVYYGRDLPSVASLRDYQPPQTTRVLDRQGELVGEIFAERRTVVPLAQIPRAMILCTLAAEDADFYLHKGFDYPGMARALFKDIMARKLVQGASTITQQVVKLLLLSSERSLSRKVRELILAWRLEQHFTKDEILHIYLNHINYGDGHYGVQAAAQYYFDKHIHQLTLAESSWIAGIPQSPTYLNPRDYPEAAARRRRFIFSQLIAKRETYWPDLSLANIEEARDTEVTFVDPSSTEKSAPEVMTLARKALRTAVGDEAYRRGGYTIHTSLDMTLQRRAREAMQHGLTQLDARHDYQGPLRSPRTRAQRQGRRQRRRQALPDIKTLRVGGTYKATVTDAHDDTGRIDLDVGGHPAYARLSRAARYNPEKLKASEFAQINARVHVSVLRLGEAGEDSPANEPNKPNQPNEPAEVQIELGPQGASVVIDPRTRDVLAMVGSYENSPGFNRALYAVRQPGSTFKPFLYGLAIKSRRYTPATIVLDAEHVDGNWRVQNADGKYRGPISLREALTHSVNTVAARLNRELGPEQLADFARSFGITTKLDATRTLGLGSSGVRPIEMVNAYATLAAGGRWEPPRIITDIVGPDGDHIALPSVPRPRDVMTPAEAYMVTSMMTSVVQKGTGRRARRLGRPVAGKTGTTNGAHDAWFIGYTTDLVTGVWVGFDDHRRPLGRRESGSRAALPIWLKTMQAASDSQTQTQRPTQNADHNFAMPSGVNVVKVDPESGLLAYEGMENVLEEVFLDGTEPTETALPPEVDDPNTFQMSQFDEEESPTQPTQPAQPVQ